MPIRILHENTVMDPGGIETLLMNVYRHIDRERIQFDFMLHRPERGFYEDEIEKLGGRVFRTPRFSPVPGEYQAYMRDVRDILIAHPEDRILHTHAELNLWPLRIAKKLEVPVRIAHSHSAQNRINVKYFFLLYEKAFIKEYCTDMFMCSRPAGIWSFGQKAVDSGKVHYVKNGIESERFLYNERVRAEVRRELYLNDNLVIGHVGRFFLPKNHSFLIEIFDSIHRQNPKSKLLLIGEGPMKEDIHHKVEKMGLSNTVIFLGNRGDVNRLMQAMDVFILPSLWEGLPLTGIEAQASGLPVLFSDSITEEVCITPNASRLSLSRGAAEWADAALSRYEKHKRTNTQVAIESSGFDIKYTAQWLQEFYLQKYSMFDH